jgi:hypothetical protein
MSEHQKTTQAILSDQSEFKEHQTIEKFALFLSDGRNLMEVLAEFDARLVDLEP